MSGGFGAQTPAIASTASAFDAQADPILQQAERLESIKGSARPPAGRTPRRATPTTRRSPGRSRRSSGRSARNALGVDELSDTQSAYDSADASGSAGLSSSGSGVT